MISLSVGWLGASVARALPDITAEIASNLTMGRQAPDTRCPLVNTGHLWRIAVVATGDPAFGIKVANHHKHTTFHALGYGTSASSTLKEAFERVRRYCHVVSDAVDYQFFRRGSEYHFVMEPAEDI